MTSILIADDHALFRRGIALILERAFDPVKIGEAGDADEAISQLKAQPWDLMLLDLGLPGRSGLEVLREVHKSHPKLPVLVLSGLPEDEFALRTLQDGAMGYLSKDCASSDLIEAVQRLLAGGRHITASVAEKLADQLVMHAGAANPATDLSGRLLEVVLLIGKGRTVKEIAAELQLSIKTVSTYRQRAMEHLQLHSTAELVRYCIRRGWVK
jgi:DNA-binding NarL/FixJ family response regulator